MSQPKVLMVETWNGEEWVITRQEWNGKARRYEKSREYQACPGRKHERGESILLDGIETVYAPYGLTAAMIRSVERWSSQGHAVSVVAWPEGAIAFEGGRWRKIPSRKQI
jgi:hypothetical protein